MADDGLRETTQPSPQEVCTQRGALTAACGLSADELEKGGHQGGTRAGGTELGGGAGTFPGLSGCCWETLLIPTVPGCVPAQPCSACSREL